MALGARQSRRHSCNHACTSRSQLAAVTGASRQFPVTAGSGAETLGIRLIYPGHKRTFPGLVGHFEKSESPGIANTTFAASMIIQTEPLAPDFCQLAFLRPRPKQYLEHVSAAWPMLAPHAVCLPISSISSTDGALQQSGAVNVLGSTCTFQIRDACS